MVGCTVVQVNQANVVIIGFRSYEGCICGL